VVDDVLSVHVYCPMLDGKKVGAPNMVSTVVASGTAPETSAPAQTPATDTAVDFTSQINRFTSSDWLNGVWRREAGISVPNSTAARDAFNPGVRVRFCDGQGRRITRVCSVGPHLSAYFDGPRFDAAQVRGTNTVITTII